MKKTKILVLFTLLITQLSFSQLTTDEVNEVITIVQDNSTDAAETLTIVQNNSIDATEATTIAREISCDAIDDIFNLKCPRYQAEIDSSEPDDYSGAIALALSDADDNGGGVILFPGNRIVEIDSVLNVKSNITFRASHSLATIKCSDSFSSNQMVVLGNRQNVTFDGIQFDADNKAMGIAAYGTANSNIDIVNCVFENTDRAGYADSGIYMLNVTDLNIRNCVFKNGFYGISLLKRNSRIYIENNKFENTLDNSPIRIHGTQTENDFSNHVWIRGNDIRIERSISIIDEHATLIRDTETGAVSGLSLINGSDEDEDGDGVPDASNYNVHYHNWRNGSAKGHYAIDITCSSEEDETSVYYHENIVVENNIAIGPDYGFFDGGSADLYGLKDIVRLKCVNNVARNSGDLGFAIVNCSSAIVSGNTADRNNSSGIGIFDTRNSVITNNVLENNGLRRDYIYNGTPYGGILITGGKSYNNILEGNHFFSFPTDVSIPITNAYTNRGSHSDYYGIVIRPDFYDVGSGSSGIDYSKSPFSNKIGNNHYAGLKWGSIYNPIPSTQISDNFAAIDFPKNRDYPLGTWIRNSNLNTIALGWSVINRVEAVLEENWNPPIPGTGTLPTPLKVIDESNTIEKDDIIGVMLDDGNVHWTIINDATFDTDHYNLVLDQYPTLSISDAVEDPGSMKRIVILRWKTVSH